MRVRRQSGRRVAIGVSGLVCAGVCAASASAAQTSVTINQANGVQGWTVPAGVSSIQMDVWGAGGGAGWGAAGPRGEGGAGAEVTATLAVSAGEWFGFGIGQAGANGSPKCPAALSISPAMCLKAGLAAKAGEVIRRAREPLVVIALVAAAVVVVGTPPCRTPATTR